MEPRTENQIAIATLHVALGLAVILHPSMSGKGECETGVQTQQRQEIHREISGSSGVPGILPTFFLSQQNISSLSSAILSENIYYLCNNLVGSRKKVGCVVW